MELLTTPPDGAHREPDQETEEPASKNVHHQMLVEENRARHDQHLIQTQCPTHRL